VQQSSHKFFSEQQLLNPTHTLPGEAREKGNFMPKFSGFRGYCEKADMVAAVRSYATG
jgi:hypothetical protein